MTRQGAGQLADLTVTEFLEAVGSNRPAPGGGAAAALTGALAAALAEMVAGLTAGRGRDAPVHDQMGSIRLRGATLKTQLLMLVDADADAYSRVGAAARLPKDTAAARGIRAAALQVALQAATETPLATAEACAEACELAGTVIRHGNRTAIGDAAAAALLAHAALHVAVRNIRINVRGISDDTFSVPTAARAAELLAAGDAALACALAAADEREMQEAMQIHRIDLMTA